MNRFEKSRYLALSDVDLDRMIPIKDTTFDRHRKLSEEDIQEMIKMRQSGATYSEITEKFSVSATCARYWIEPSFREYLKKYVKGKEYKRKKTPKERFEERVNYKKSLIVNNYIK